MTIRITDDFAVRRIGSLMTATIIEDGFPARATLNAKQARDAAEAFNVLAVMLGACGDEQEEKEAA
ncbi:hypothetical protein [Mesorhizobium retamae]|uniref:Uncharacterized protein n=1 Tax=Mesorhizobium retamae TaxID=2912854 RepID=A0ABS9QHZ4_9HYPH|nr:hypothetical protein [Mesorhizobium sp. IRAMC:0171]MCG7507035.1 hypothetical protein [Mesorhizobium sp. IRAMC:0171]